VVRTFEVTGLLLSRRIAQLSPAGPVTFYVWHDKQAGQLRCSLSSRAPASLPFAGGRPGRGTAPPPGDCRAVAAEPEW
jgi:hypothetical protein